MGQVCSKLPAPWQHPAGMWEKNGLNGDICSVLLISLLQPGQVKGITCSPPCPLPAALLPPPSRPSPLISCRGGGARGHLIALQIATGKGGWYIVRGAVNISILGSLESNRGSSAREEAAMRSQCVIAADRRCCSPAGTARSEQRGFSHFANGSKK